MPGLPVVRIDDVVVHPRENDLVLATHGRSIYIMDDVSALQAMSDSILALDAHLVAPRTAVLWKENMRRDRAVTGDKNWTGENAPEGTAIHYYLAEDVENVEVHVVDLVSGETVRDLDPSGDAGLNRVRWDLRANPEDEDDDQGPVVEPGVYRIVLAVNGAEHTALVEVIEDDWMPVLAPVTISGN
jgi:hypothetical protein